MLPTKSAMKRMENSQLWTSMKGASFNKAIPEYHTSKLKVTVLCLFPFFRKKKLDFNQNQRSF